MTLEKFMLAWPEISARTSTVEKLYEALKEGGFKFEDVNTTTILRTFMEVYSYGKDEGFNQARYEDTGE